MIHCSLASKMNYCFLILSCFYFLVLLYQAGIIVVIITLFVPRNGKINEPWKFLLHCFSPVANMCSFPSQGMCLSPSPVWGYRWSRCQWEEWCRAGVHPAGATDLGAGNSTTVTDSAMGSQLSKKNALKMRGLAGIWFGCWKWSSGSQGAQNSNRYRVQWFS